jgi:hypothetical protein
MNSDSENREWLNKYMSLKQVNPDNPFTVPEGYFNELEQRILSAVKLDELKKSALGQSFTVPENYFEELPGNIQSRINIEEAANKEATGFTVPEGYFDKLQQQIQSRILVEEALNGQAEAFTVPQNYFSDLTQNILNKTISQERAKRGIVRQLFASATFKYATAACLTLGVGATIFFSQNTKTPIEEHNSSFLHKSLSAIPVDEIQSYLQLHLDANDTRTLIDENKQVNAENLNNDLEDYLDTTSQ